MLAGFEIVLLGYDKYDEAMLGSLLAELGASTYTVDIHPSSTRRDGKSIIYLASPSYTGPLPTHTEEENFCGIGVNNFWVYETVFAGVVQSFDDFPMHTNWQPLSKDHVYHRNNELLLYFQETLQGAECPSEASRQLISRFLFSDASASKNPYKTPESLVPLVQSLPELNFKDWISGGLSNMTTLAIVEFISYLVELNYVHIDEFLITSGTMDALFHIFVRYPLENVLHLAITRIYIEAIQNNHQKLRHYLFYHNKLLDVISEKIEDDFFRPHFAEIANAFYSMSTSVCKNFTKIISETKQDDLFTTKLPAINLRNGAGKWKEETSIIQKTRTETTNLRDSMDYESLPLSFVTEPTFKRTYTCTYCGVKTEDNSIQCPKCRSLTYCSRDCQKRHWREGHSKECS